MGLAQARPNITTKEIILLGNIHNSIHDIKFARYQGNTMKTDLAAMNLALGIR